MITIEEIDDRFYIEKSNLPHAGYGCFAKTLMKKGDWLEIIGVLVKTDSVADECTHYAKRYKFMGSKKGYKIVPMGLGGLVNHTDERAMQNVQLTCIPGLAKRSEHSSEVVYQALRDIKPGEELLGYYGDQINSEIEKNITNLSYVEENRADWQKFLSFDLYHLKCLEEIL